MLFLSIMVQVYKVYPVYFVREVHTTWDISVKIAFWLFLLVLPALYFIISLSSFPTSITNDNAGVLSVRWACSLAVWQLPGRFGVVGLGDPPHRFALHCMQAVATLSSHSNDY